MDECAANQVESALDGIWEILALHPWDLIYLSIPMSISRFMCCPSMQSLSLYRNGIREVAHPVCCI